MSPVIARSPLQALQTELAALQNLQGQPPELIRDGAGTSFDQSSVVKRTKKTADQPRQLQLETATVKELTKKDFELVNGGGGGGGGWGRNTCTCH